jgi:enoyl-CoA hydratase/carnithine racemase
MSMPDAVPAVAVALSATLASLDLLRVEVRGAVVHVRLDRPAKRNAVSDALVAQLHTCFVNLPDATRAVVLSGEGDHFCAGLDLAEVSERSVAEGIFHSRSWHAAFERVQFGKVPVVAVLHGAVVGGGLELAASCHVRVAEPSAFYGLPEGQRGLFVGGGGSARIPRLIGTARMTDMMLTGRVYDAQEGHAVGISHYLVQPGEGLAKAFALAERIAANAPLSNFAVMHALPRIADMAQDEGLFVESLMAAIASGDEAAKLRIRAFLEGRAAKVKKT